MDPVRPFLTLMVGGRSGCYQAVSCCHPGYFKAERRLSRLAGSDPLPTVARNWSRHSPTKQQDRKRPSSRWHRNHGSGWLGISAQCRYALQHNKYGWP